MATVEELKDQAKALEIEGYSTMNKAELEAAVAEAEADGNDTDNDSNDTEVAGITGDTDNTNDSNGVDNDVEAATVSNTGDAEATNRLAAPVTRQGRNTVQKENGTYSIGIKG